MLTLDLRLFQRVFTQVGAVMTLEACGIVFLQFPIRYFAYCADLAEPLVAQPPRRPAAAGIVDDKSLTAVGGDPCLFADFVHIFDAVQYALTGGPQLDFVD